MQVEYIKSLPTEALIGLRSSINSELSLRKKKQGIANSCASDQQETPETNKKIDQFNAASLLAIRSFSSHLGVRQRYFKSLIDQDWSSVYPCNLGGVGEYYVYVHLDPSGKMFGEMKGQPFYVGKGIGQRAYDLKRNQGHGKKIKQVLDSGWSKSDIVHIAFSGLSESKAYEIESKMIYFFGSIYEKGKGKSCLYNLEIPRKPKFEGVMLPHLNKYQLKQREEAIKSKA